MVLKTRRNLSGGVTVSTGTEKEKRQLSTVAKRAEQDVAAAAEAEKEIGKLPKPPKQMATKQTTSTQDSVINAQRRAIDSLLAVVREKDAFIKEWEVWVGSIRTCTESVREAEKLLRNVDNKRVEELEKALETANGQTVALTKEVDELKQRIKHLLGQ